jgi:phage terminase small subunit
MEIAMARKPMSVRLTDDARQLLSQLSSELGVSKSDVIELAIREKARRSHDEDSWAYTPEYRAAIERARQSPSYSGVTSEDLEALVAADDPAATMERLKERWTRYEG